MERRPRDPESPILETRHWRVLIDFSVLIGAVVLLSMVVAEQFFGLSTDQAVTVSFLTLAFAQLWHVFNMRETGTGLIRNDIMSNGWVWAALGLCLVLILGAAMLPGISGVLSLVALPLSGWTLALGASLVPLLAGGVIRRIAAGDRPLFGTE